MKRIIKNAKIYTMSEAGILENADILILDNKIIEIGTINAEADDIIDASGKLVFPGFIDAHSHIGIFEDSMGFEGADANEDTDPVTPHLRAIDGINPCDISFTEALSSGITATATGPGSANVIGGQFAAIKTYGTRIDNMIIKAPVAMKVAFGENPKRVYKEKNKTPATRIATAAMLREVLFKTAEYLSKKEKSAAKNEDGPEYNIKFESLIPVLKGEIPLKAHAHRADDIYTAIRIAREFNLKLTLEHVTDGYLILDELKKEKYPCIVGPNLAGRTKIELKNLSFKNPGLLSKNGIMVAIMTDHPVIPIQYLVLCAALSVKDGMDEYEALKAITINPAKILGIDDRVGSIEKGKDADIVIMNGHPFDTFSIPQIVFVDGEVAYKTEK
ncbi:amidohydrolase [Methanosarcina sp. MSH10X1]|uniref:amidohydrolase n=1 Tax=Methanosarcina sp. MSH10X1 TaxID=2507075 RepID=UPI000FFB48BE|nr:amidohydrolase [Methanosarcina sp. MSH10X1]RXA20578.1 amidohydrolase [Methanosarcina sp. MSH10X1]